MKHFDHIVFDVDGTLADTEESVLSSLVQIVQEETSKTLPRHELDFALGIPGKDALEKLGIYSQATLDRWCQVAASFKSTISVFPGLLEVIATLADSGCKLGNVVYVGDTVYDEQCATSAGVSFARAAWGSHQDIPNATYNLKTPNDLLTLTTK